MSQKAVNSIEEIKNILNKNTQILSLSGWSGIMAGIIALIAAAIAQSWIDKFHFQWRQDGYYDMRNYLSLRRDLILLGLGTLSAALLLATFFTFRKIRKDGDELFSRATTRLMFHLAVPLLTGGVFIIYLLEHGLLNLIAPCCLIFYGLGLFAASKFTLGEILYLGLTCILLGLVSLWLYSYTLIFWALGFGVAHILYGTMMLRKYE